MIYLKSTQECGTKDCGPKDLMFANLYWIQKLKLCIVNKFVHNFLFRILSDFRVFRNLTFAIALTVFNLNEVSNYFWRVRYTEVQWNLLKADILFSGQLSPTDNFLQNKWNDVQTFIAKSLCSGHPTIADIIFTSQITLHPRTLNNRPYKKYP